VCVRAVIAGFHLDSCVGVAAGGRLCVCAVIAGFHLDSCSQGSGRWWQAACVRVSHVCARGFESRRGLPL
jgi:hypothetical protein